MPSDFTVFECTRLLSWLRLDVCADRYRKATTHGITVGRDKFKALHGTHCTNCPVGKAHSKTKTFAAGVRLRVFQDGALSVAPPRPEGVTMVSPIKLNPRPCRICKTDFDPRGPTDYYCSDECRAQKPAVAPAPTAPTRAPHPVAVAKPGNQRPPRPRPVTKPVIAPMPMARTAEAQELLALAGYQVRSVQTPAGVMLLVT
jgi:hypothetical protein